MNTYDEEVYQNSQSINCALFCTALEITFAAIGYFIWFWIVEGRV